MKNSLTEAIIVSFKDLIEQDGELFGFQINEGAEENARKLHEVCVNHQLSIHLSNHIFPLLRDRGQPYFADIEFNRNGEREKAVVINGQKQVVRPDIIIHNRKEGVKKSNFLIVECKKDGCSGKDIDDDKIKIKGLMESENYQYEYGLMVLYKEQSIEAEFFYHKGGKIVTEPLSC